jgi:dihydroflavonol-4-reductase
MSKTEAEKLAWRLAKQHQIWMVSILPSALIGPHCYK